MYNSYFFEALSKLDDVYDNEDIVESATFTIQDNEVLTEDVDNGDDTVLDPVATQGNREEVLEANNVLNDQKICMTLDKLTDAILNAGEAGITVNKDSGTGEAAISAARKFNKGKAYTWPYQLQLLCNAYLSEQAVINYLTDNTAEDPTNVINKLQAQLGQTFDFGSKEVTTAEKPEIHNQIYISAADKGKKAYDLDIKLTDKTDEKTTAVFKGEVKVVWRDPDDARDFHDADIVFIVAIDKQSSGNQAVWCKIKDGNGYTYLDGDKQEIGRIPVTFIKLKKDIEVPKQATFLPR